MRSFLSVAQGKEISEKNWVPMVINNTLHLIRHLDPLHVLKCLDMVKCEFVRNDTDAFTYQMDDLKVPLRGGTSFELYRYKVSTRCIYFLRFIPLVILLDLDRRRACVIHPKTTLLFAVN